MQRMEQINNTEETTTALSKGRGSKILWLVVLVVVIVLLALWQQGTIALGTRKNTYQAVFLTNNQVYFGKLSSAEAQYPVLRDIYYLQVTQALQPKDQNASPQTNINLVKLGAEIHGPTDEMRINRDQILFVEDLKPDSQVTKAIEQYKTSQPVQGQ